MVQHFHRVLRAACLLLSCTAAGNAPAQGDPGIEFFERKIRPALIEHCHECHSAEAENPKGRLLLDSRAGLLKGGESGRAVVPGQVSKSLLIEAIRRQSFEMPPSGKLPDAIISDFVKWIEMGAPIPRDDHPQGGTGTWQEQLSRRSRHWSWQPMRRTALPAVAGADKSSHPVDRFILAKLAEGGLVQAPLADRRTLLRRLHFVLLGTPPTPSEVNRFITDRRTDDEVWQQVVDRLLATPAFGERWARHWMDVVRYAETHGSEHDAVLPKSWRYRDYLIRAFNEDLPYDSFVREHLAGDIPSNARWNDDLRINEAALATAWLRMTEFYHSPVDVKNEEAAVVENLIDTFGKAFQAQTLACARCHDHKFDPVSDEDYYALYGVFTSSRQGMLIVDRPEIFHEHDEEIRSIKRNIRRLLAAVWRQQIVAWPSAIKNALKELAREHKQNESSHGKPDPWIAILKPSRAFSIEHALYPLAELGRIWKSDDSWAGEWLTTQQRMKAALPSVSLREDYEIFADLRGDDLSDWHGRGPGFANLACAPAGAFALHHEGDQVVAGILPAGVYSHLVSQRQGGSLRSPGFTLGSSFVSALVMGEDDSRLRLVIENFQGDTILFAPAMPRLKAYRTPRWVRLPIRKQWFGRRAYLELLGRDDDPYIGIIGKETPGMERPSDGRSSCGLLQVVLHDDGQSPRLAPAWDPLLCDAVNTTVDEILTQFRATVGAAIEAWEKETPNDRQARLLDALLQAGHLQNAVAGQTELAALVDRYRQLEEQIPVPRRVPAMMDEGAGQDVAFFPRGNHRTPGASIGRRYLEVLGSDSRSFLSDGGSGRNQLAKEIASHDNPLTARVMVNRLWHWTFGRGIVSTVDNFGSMGKPPTHPELLDYLATRFVDHGWSIKDTIRLLVTSRTFRIRSDAAVEAMEMDPQNKLLQHAHLRRLDGEAIRDSILTVSGSLNNKMFGPAVPVWLSDSHVSNHKPKNGPLDGNGRRSIYIEVRRNNPYAFFHVFNRPKPTHATGARDVTTVPAQSLTLLNDPFVINQAEKWACLLIQERGHRSLEDVVSAMYEQVFARPASSVEVSRVQEFLRDQATTYGLDIQAVDEGKGFDDPRPLRDLAHALLNHKEFLYVQ